MARSRVRVIDGGGNGFRRSDMEDGIPSMPAENRSISGVRDLLKFAAEDLPEGTLGIAYATAGIIKDHDLVVLSPNLHWLNRIKLGTLTTKNTGLPTVVANDMEAAVTGMRVLVPAVKGAAFIGITWSTGIGMRFVDSNGQIVFPDTEGGHVRIDNSLEAPLCGCGQHGCVEAIAGGESLRWKVLSDTRLLGIDIPKGVHPCRFLDEAYGRGDPWAVSTYSFVTEAMADLLAIMQTIGHVPAIVWKGTVAERMIPIIGNDIKAKLARKLINPIWAGLDFHLSPHTGGVKNADSFAGAAEIFLQEVMRK